MDYSKLGLKCGLEIHQQLDTNKLFCSCPSILQEREPDLTITRSLHAVAGETGEVDIAALQAQTRGSTYIYQVFNDSNCLVELDEEPPQLINSEALDTVLTVSLMLNANVIDELHVMRKTVVDGSNVSGFQRTSLVAMAGSLDVSGLTVGIPTICIEEDAARKVSTKDGVSTYSLDRLGIPLIELATDPVITTPEQVRDVAKSIGDIIRATKKAKRGIGTIRQDVNVSIKEGARVEVKGVQDLNILSKVVENEVLRQVKLLEIREELNKRGAKVGAIKDITDVMKKSDSKVIKAALEKKGIVLGLKLEKFAGMLGKEVQPGRRIGTELSDYAKAYGSKGLFHSDELPAFGITDGDVDAIKKALGCGKEDAFVIIAEGKEICESSVNAAAGRAKIALEKVPEETRQAQQDGTSSYMRPLAGGSRMYPETDLPPLVFGDKKLAELKKNLPKFPWEYKAELEKNYGLSKEIADSLYRSNFLELFEELVKKNIDPKIMAVTFTNYVKALKDPQVLQEQHYCDLFKAYSSGKFSKEAIPDILEKWVETPGEKLDAVVKGAGAGSMEDSKLEKVIEKVVKDNKKLINEKGDRAIQPLMGLVMKEVRGKADGKVVMELLKKKIGK